MYVIKAICLAEIKQSIVYHIRISLCVTTGDIKHAECGCPAGLAPTASCKHIGALGCTLEEFGRMHVLHTQVACTSQLQSWNLPRKRKIETAEVENIKFVQMKYG